MLVLHNKQGRVIMSSIARAIASKYYAKHLFGKRIDGYIQVGVF